jgi:hypothetical protein
MRWLWILVLLAGSGLGAAPAREADPPAVVSIDALWQMPRNIAAQDLLNGPWGKANAPGANAIYEFVRPKTRASSPGLVVRDSQGRTWHVKQGREASPEVVVSRVLSAIGYHQPPVYFLPSFLVNKSKDDLVAEDAGRFRLSRPELNAQGDWEWERNPFVGTRPYQGLLVVLVLLNSADLKESNNKIYFVADPAGGVSWRYIVRDLGTSFGKTNRFNPPPNRLDAFEHQPFIVGVRDGFVEFDYGAVNNNLVRGRITPEDVRWACVLLGGLTDRQWRDAFRAGGYEPEIAGRFIRRIKEKIAEGRHLP